MKSNYILITLISICIISNTIQAQNKKSFKPGTVWTDNNGSPINAHGGGIIYVDGIYIGMVSTNFPINLRKKKQMVVYIVIHPLICIIGKTKE